MTQFSVLTSAAKTIVDNFFNIQKYGFFSDRQLMVSLYSIMPDADQKVIDILKKYVVSLSDLMPESELNILKSEYPEVVKYCYDLDSFDTKIVGAVMPLPHSVVKLCMNIVKPKSGSSVFVPYSGEGDLAYHVSDCKIDGFELNPESWAITQILLHSQKSESNIVLGDQFDPDSKQYDYIFSFPPFLKGKDETKVVDTIYNLITKHLAEDGILCCVLPMKFCYESGKWPKVRNILNEYKGQYSAMVVALPPVLQPFSGITVCILLVNKSHKDIVALVDTSSMEFLARKDVAGTKEYELKTKSIIETIESQDEKYMWVGTSLMLKEYLILQPSYYLNAQHIPGPKKGETAFVLSDLIEIVPDTRKTMTKARMSTILMGNRDGKKRCPVIGMRELSSSYLNCDINREDLDDSTEIPSYPIVTSDCILIGFIGGKFKVGRLHGASLNYPIALKYEVVPVRIISDAITEDFLLRSIMSEMVEQQTNRMATGAIITRLRQKDLLSIVINVPFLKTIFDCIFLL